MKVYASPQKRKQEICSNVHSKDWYKSRMLRCTNSRTWKFYRPVL